MKGTVSIHLFRKMVILNNSSFPFFSSSWNLCKSLFHCHWKSPHSQNHRNLLWLLGHWSHYMNMTWNIWYLIRMKVYFILNWPDYSHGCFPKAIWWNRFCQDLTGWPEIGLKQFVKLRAVLPGKLGTVLPGKLGAVLPGKWH